MTKWVDIVVAAAMAAFLCVGAGCGSSDKPKAEHPVKKRAPFDLDCPHAQIRYHRLDRATVGVEGCGQRATYVKVCRETVDEAGSFFLGSPVTDTRCQWIMNTTRQ